VDGKFEGEVADIATLQGGDIGAPVSVPPPGVGEEEPVVGKERWEELQRLKAVGMTVSGIARATGQDRKTMRRCVRQVRWQAYRRAPGFRVCLMGTVPKLSKWKTPCYQSLQRLPLRSHQI
jgi:hypothetical protein